MRLAPLLLFAASAVVSAPAEGAPASAERITSRGYVTWIYDGPDATRRFVGYVRNGSSIALRSTELTAGLGCVGGFFAVAPRGFVCNDRTVTRTPSPRAVETSLAASRRAGPLPFRYAFSDGAPMYNRIPTAAEQERAELGFGPRGDARAPFERPAVYHDLATLDAIAPSDPVPTFLAQGGTAAERRIGLVKETLPAGSILSFTRSFEAEGRTWLLSADQALVPADRVRPFAVSSFHGVALGGAAKLPLAWMRGAPRARHRAAGDHMESEGSWPVRSFVGLTGASIEREGKRYLETTERDPGGESVFLADEDATVVEPASALPTGVKRDQKWIRVSLTRGTLVAYEGLTPVYATLISPGRGGLPIPGHDAVEDSTTPLGTFSITFKDRAVTMSPDTPGGPRRHYISDVPHVQYFKAPFALHAAIWHERFGEPASAGCINASPLDAEALFAWTDPPVPDEWQGAAGAGAPGNGKTTMVVVTR